MSKIQEFITENKITPHTCTYHTQRSALNAQGKPTGKIRVLAMPDGIARVEYTCPECQHSAYTEVPWKRPFYVKCEKCGFKITVPKMKQQFKKEQKAENAAESSEESSE